MGTGRDLHIVCPLDQKVAQIFKNMDYGYYRLRNHTSIFRTDSAIQKGLILGARPACLEEHCVVAEEMLCIIDYSLILLLLHDCEIPFSLPSELLGLNSLTVFAFVAKTGVCQGFFFLSSFSVSVACVCVAVPSNIYFF